MIFYKLECKNKQATKNLNLLWRLLSFVDNEVPLDHTPEIEITRKTVQEGIPSYIYFTMCAIASLGSAMAFSLLIFNIKFRQQK